MPRIAASTALCAIAVAAAAMPAAVPAATGAGALDRRERAVVVQINRQRAAHGLRELRTDDALARAADAHSADMLARRYFGHSTLVGESWSARVAGDVHTR